MSLGEMFTKKEEQKYPGEEGSASEEDSQKESRRWNLLEEVKKTASFYS